MILLGKFNIFGMTHPTGVPLASLWSPWRLHGCSSGLHCCSFCALTISLKEPMALVASTISLWPCCVTILKASALNPPTRIPHPITQPPYIQRYPTLPLVLLLQCHLLNHNCPHPSCHLPDVKSKFMCFRTRLPQMTTGQGREGI